MMIVKNKAKDVWEKFNGLVCAFFGKIMALNNSTGIMGENREAEERDVLHGNLQRLEV